MDYPKYKSPGGHVYTCIGWACGMPKINWEWYAFEDQGDGIYWGYVMGFENEFGSFSAQELHENGIHFYTDPEVLREIASPIRIISFAFFSPTSLGKI